jgi:hypothetical protein
MATDLTEPPIPLQRRLGQLNSTVQQFERFVFFPTQDTIAIQRQPCAGTSLARSAKYSTRNISIIKKKKNYIFFTTKRLLL